MKINLFIALMLCLYDRSYAQLKFGENSIGINGLPASGKTLDVKGGNGGQLRLNNAGESSTSLEFSNNGIRRAFFETNTSNNEFKIVSEADGQSVKIYTLGIERFSVSSDGIITLPGGIKFGGNAPTAGTIRWTGTAFEGYDGIAWKALNNISNPVLDKQNKTMFYLDNNPY